MPEGPEIKLAADKIAKALVGQVTDKVYFAFEHLKPYQTCLAGHKVTTVEARSKALLVRFANGLNIYSHNQLYGVWQVRKAYDFGETRRQLRVAIHNANWSALLYSASDIEVLSDAQLDDHPYLKKLGPNLLDPVTTVEQVIHRFQAKKFQRRRLTSLLLDQHFLAGLGNYLRSEVLFVAGVHPTLRPMDCSAEQIEKLGRAATQLTWQSYHTQGITNDLAQAEQLKKDGVPYSQYRFWVFNREAEPCYTCGTSIVKDSAAGRRIYFCPVCQVVQDQN